MPFPHDVNQQIIKHMRTKCAELIINAYEKRQLRLRYVREYDMKNKRVWYELSPTSLGSYIYGNNMFICRDNIWLTENLCLY